MELTMLALIVLNYFVLHKIFSYYNTETFQIDMI